MKNPEPTITVHVDLTNPGQFFACCGLLELADRLWPGAEGWFEARTFYVSAAGNLKELMDSVRDVELVQCDLDNKTASPIEIGEPFRKLRLDWWLDDRAGGKMLKVWAGRMESVRIAKAMQLAMKDERFHSSDMFNVGLVAYDPEPPHKKKVEPFYFDSRRGPNAHSRDVGFSPNTLSLTTTAFPAVEFFCLVGLQRCLPAFMKQRHIYEYQAWSSPLPAILIAPVACSAMPCQKGSKFRFENWYRTGQKKHQAFRSAIKVS